MISERVGIYFESISQLRTHAAHSPFPLRDPGPAQPIALDIDD